MSPLGAGGMGEVYRARDSRLGREVALKILPERYAQDADALARFRREASAASALNHPHIVTIHDIGKQMIGGTDVHYYAMELVEGSTLREHIQHDPLKKIIGYFVQVADALAKAHAAGIVHRDLKPDNVMISGDGYAKVVDFGLAKIWVQSTSESSLTAVADTAAGTAVGTTSYMSPEQIEGRVIDSRSDIFSFGSMLYEAACGRRPFDHPSTVDTMHAIVHDPPAPSSRQVRPDLCRIIERCLAKDPDDRYQSIREPAIELRSILRELDSESVSRPAIQRPPRSIAARIVLAGALLLAIGALMVVTTIKRSDMGASAPIQSLAIMPFVNAAHNAETDYVSDGITDEIINSLSDVPQLRVLARSTVFRFKGQQADPRSLGRELGVDAVVLGELRELRDLVNVKVELVRTADGTQLWGRQYNRKAADLLTIQEEIARDISEQLRLRLRGEDARRIGRPHTQNPQAYQAYLKGLYFWNQRPGGSTKALQHFEEAVRLDPTDALAHAGVALAYDTLGAWEVGQLSPGIAFPRAKAAAQQALALDGDLPEPYAALGNEQLHFERDFAASEASFQKAIALKPSYATAHHWYSHLLIARGRFDESLRESLKALELEPVDAVITGHLSFHYVYARQPDQALEQCRKTIDLFPNSFWGFYFRGLALEQKGMLNEAAAALRHACIISPDATFSLAALGHILGRAGQRAEALSILQKLERDRAHYISPFDRAIVKISLGDRDAAFSDLEKAVQESSSWVVYFQRDARLDPLRDDPRFIALLRRAGL